MCGRRYTFENNEKLGTAQQLYVFEGFSVLLSGMQVACSKYNIILYSSVLESYDCGADMSEFAMIRGNYVKFVKYVK